MDDAGRRTRRAPASSSAAGAVLGNRWTRFATWRLGRLIVAFCVLLIATFLIIRLVPGDPVRAALGPEATEELIEFRRQQLGLDKPLWMQFVDYVTGVLRGDFGVSLGTDQPVADLLAARFPATIALGLVAFALAFAGSLLVGYLVAVVTRSGSRRWLEVLFTGVTGTFSSVPGFLLAVLLVVVFALWLGWFPVGNLTGPSSFVLPAVALAAAPAAALTRTARLQTATVLDQDYVLTARSRRLSPLRIHLRHVLPNMMAASLALGGIVLIDMLVGSVLVETVFNWPGIGRELVDAILTKDYPVVQAIVLCFGVLVLIVTAVVDAAVALLNPRSTALEG
ncbi:MAG: ABC transporter permease [Protaetiibacter sp.]